MDDKNEQRRKRPVQLALVADVQVSMVVTFK